MFGTGDRELGMCSTLPGCDIIERLEMVLQPSTMVVAPEMMLSPAEEMGPGSRMSPDMTGRESELAYLMSEREHELKLVNEEYPLLDPAMDGVVVGLKFGLDDDCMLGSLLNVDAPYMGRSLDVIMN